MLSRSVPHSPHIRGGRRESQSCRRDRTGRGQTAPGAGWHRERQTARIHGQQRPPRQTMRAWWEQTLGQSGLSRKDASYWLCVLLIGHYLFIILLRRHIFVVFTRILSFLSLMCSLLLACCYLVAHIVGLPRAALGDTRQVCLLHPGRRWRERRLGSRWERPVSHKVPNALVAAGEALRLQLLPQGF